MPPDDDQIVPSGGVPAAPTVRIEAPADYEELKAFRKGFEEKVEPRWDRVKAILEADDDELEFIDGARTNYQRIREEAKPRLSPEMQEFATQLDRKYGPVVEYIEGERKTRAEAAAAKEAADEAEKQRVFASNKAYAERIMSERPDMRTDQGFPSKKMEDLIILAAQRKLSIEDAWKEYGAEYFGARPTPVRSAEERKPPTSLRGDAATPGVPGESTAPKAQTQKERLERMRKNMIAAAGGRGA